MTKQAPTNSPAQPEKAGAPDTPLGYGMVLGIVGDRGVAIYPGQSPEEVLKIAAIIQDQTDGDIDHYKARDIAREILRAQGGRRS